MINSRILHQASKSLANQYEKERGERFSLTDPSTRLKTFRMASVDQDRDRTSTDTHLNPQNPFVSKVHSLENIKEIIPRESIKSLFEIHFKEK